MIAIISGPTATGKTAISLDFAVKSGGDIEIINADSMIVYRGLDIGTAKPSRLELTTVRHHLVDIREPDEPFTAGDFVKETHKAITDIEARGKRALIVGGTGFYLKALLHGMWEGGPSDPLVRKKLEEQTNEALYDLLTKSDPESAKRIGPNDRYRLVRALEVIQITGSTPTALEITRAASRPSQSVNERKFRLLVVDREKQELEKRISDRTGQMLDAGLLDETRWCLDKYPSSRVISAVGYRQARDYLEGRLPEGRKIAPGMDGLRQEIELATRQLVKRQRTWFRGEESSEWFTLERDADKLRATLEEIYASSCE